MSQDTAPSGGNDNPFSDVTVKHAIAEARKQLVAIGSNPSFRDDAFRALATAILATVNGIEAIYTGLIRSTQEILTHSDRRRAELAAVLKSEREQFVKDFEISQNAAVLLVKAEADLAKAEVKSGLAESAKAALQDVLKEDRHQGYWRMLGVSCGAAILLLCFGFAAGWFTDRVLGTERIARDMAATGVLAQAEKDNVDAIRTLSAQIAGGMTPAELLGLVSLSHNVAINVVGPVPEEEMPWPCIAVVPAGAIKLTNGKPIPACVIPLQDSVRLHGGYFLTQELAALRETQR